jgi:hypothetical protein
MHASGVCVPTYVYIAFTQMYQELIYNMGDLGMGEGIHKDFFRFDAIANQPLIILRNFQ